MQSKNPFLTWNHVGKGFWRRDYKLSLGASFYRQKEQMSFDRLYQEADQAMYASKKQAGFAMTIYHTVE